MADVKPIPEGFRTVTPYLTLKDAGGAIEFYKKAFAAEEVFRMPGPDGKSVMHAEVQIGDSRIMMSEECSMPDGPQSPQSLNGTSVTVHMYVEDVDASFQRAVGAGAKGVMPPVDMFWGDRFAKVVDPYGHHWSIATHTKDLTPDEIAQGAAEAFKQGPCGQ